MENLQFFFSQPSLQDAEGEASPDAAVPRNLRCYVVVSCLPRIFQSYLLRWTVFDRYVLGDLKATSSQGAWKPRVISELCGKHPQLREFWFQEKTRWVYVFWIPWHHRCRWSSCLGNLVKDFPEVFRCENSLNWWCIKLFLISIATRDIQSHLPRFGIWTPKTYWSNTVKTSISVFTWMSRVHNDSWQNHHGPVGGVFFLTVWPCTRWWFQVLKLFSTLLGEDSNFDFFFKMGWFNHQLVHYWYRGITWQTVKPREVTVILNLWSYVVFSCVSGHKIDKSQWWMLQSLGKIIFDGSEIWQK